MFKYFQFLWQAKNIWKDIKGLIEQYQVIFSDGLITSYEVSNFFVGIFRAVKLFAPPKIDAWIESDIIPFIQNLFRKVVFQFNVEERNFVELRLTKGSEVLLLDE